MLPEIESLWSQTMMTTLTKPNVDRAPTRALASREDPAIDNGVTRLSEAMLRHAEKLERNASVYHDPDSGTWRDLPDLLDSPFREIAEELRDAPLDREYLERFDELSEDYHNAFLEALVRINRLLRSLPPEEENYREILKERSRRWNHGSGFLTDLRRGAGWALDLREAARRYREVARGLANAGL